MYEMGFEKRNFSEREIREMREMRDKKRNEEIRNEIINKYYTTGELSRLDADFDGVMDRLANPPWASSRLMDAYNLRSTPFNGSDEEKEDAINSEIYYAQKEKERIIQSSRENILNVLRNSNGCL